MTINPNISYAYDEYSRLSSKTTFDLEKISYTYDIADMSGSGIDLGKIYEYDLDRGSKIENLTKEESRGLEQTLILLYHTLNAERDKNIKYYNFVNGIGPNNGRRETYYKSAMDHVKKYPSLYENFVEEELNALKEDMNLWWN